MASLGKQRERGTGTRAHSLRRDFVAAGIIGLVLSSAATAGARASTIAISSPTAQAALTLAQQSSGDALAQARSTAASVRQLLANARAVVPQPDAVPSSATPSGAVPSPVTVVVPNIRAAVTSALPAPQPAPPATPPPGPDAATTRISLQAGAPTSNSPLAGQLLARHHESQQTSRRWLASHRGGRGHAVPPGGRALTGNAQRPAMPAGPMRYWQPAAITAPVVASPARRAATSGTRGRPHPRHRAQAPAPSPGGAVPQVAAPQSVPSAPGGGAASASGGGTGAGPASALLAVAALWLLQSLLSGRLPFDLPAWRSAWPAPPLTRPG